MEVNLPMISSKHVELSIENTKPRIMSSLFQIVVMIIFPSININDFHIGIIIIIMTEIAPAMITLPSKYPQADYTAAYIFEGSRNSKLLKKYDLP